MASTIHDRRRNDAERARRFRASKSKRLETGTATPDSRDVQTALAEAVVLTYAERLDDVSPGWLVKIALGVLIRDGFARDASKNAIFSFVTRPRSPGPHPLEFLGRSRDLLWREWDETRESRSAAEVAWSLRAFAEMAET